MDFRSLIVLLVVCSNHHARTTNETIRGTAFIAFHPFSLIDFTLGDLLSFLQTNLAWILTHRLILHPPLLIEWQHLVCSGSIRRDRLVALVCFSGSRRYCPLVLCCRNNNR